MLACEHLRDGAFDGDLAVLEEVTINFDKVTYAYKTQDDQGAGSKPYTMEWRAGAKN